MGLPHPCKPDSVPPAEAGMGGHFSSRRAGSRGCGMRLLPGVMPKRRAGGPFPLFCLAPRGVCRASRVAPGSGGLLPPRFTLTWRSPTLRLGGTRRFVFCGTFRYRGRCLPGPPAFAGRAALWSPDFPLACASDRPGCGRRRLRHLRLQCNPCPPIRTFSLPCRPAAQKRIPSHMK